MAIPASKTDYLTINNGDLTIKHTGIGIYWDVSWIVMLYM
jgi:hypothetical protein